MAGHLLQAFFIFFKSSSALTEVDVFVMWEEGMAMESSAHFPVIWTGSVLGGAWEVAPPPLISWGSSHLSYTISIIPSTRHWFLLSLESIFLALSLKILGQVSCCCEYAKLPRSDQEQKGAISFIVHSLYMDRQWANYWNSHHLQDIWSSRLWFLEVPRQLGAWVGLNFIVLLMPGI